MSAAKRRAILALADGSVFDGIGFGAEGETSGELVFHTAATGYQEILSDPASAGQLAVFAYPEIGNTGINDEDCESDGIHAAGVIVRNLALAPSSHRSQRSLGEALAEQGVPGLQGIDTRMLIRRLRDGGPQQALLSTRADAWAPELVERARSLSAPGPHDLSATVSTRAIYEVPASGDALHHVVAYDFGIKRAMLRRLAERGCRITVLSSTTPAAEALALAPDGIFLSGGPGVPAASGDAVGVVRSLLGKLPIFGIGFGHQLLALAAGAAIVRLERSHRGLGQPVRDSATGRILITAQAHDFAVSESSLEGSAAVVSHRSVHDGCVEGIDLPGRRAFGIQFQAESSPGPHDSLGLFDRFTAMMGEARR